MRVRTFAVLLPVAALAGLTALATFAGCKSKGNGIGTAPPDQACPTSTPVEGSTCPGLLVCDYSGTCADAGSGGKSVVMICGAESNANWVCYQLGDASIPEAGPTDGASDADGGSDADADEVDAADAPDSDAGDAEAGDAGDIGDADASDADTGPDAVTDSALDGDADVASDADADASDAD